MNVHTPASRADESAWALPDMTVIWPRADAGGRSPDEHGRWKDYVPRMRDIALRHGWSKREAADRIGMSDGTFNQWFSGKYGGRYDTMNDKVAQFLALQAETDAAAVQMPTSPPFMNLHSSGEIMQTLQAAQVMPALVIITAAAGVGKTTTCETYQATRPHVFMATACPHTRTVHGMLVEIARCIGLDRYNPARLVPTIGAQIKRRGAGSLLIVDEAQNLSDDAVNQLRHFVDQYGCGVAVVGNTETYGRFSTKEAAGTKYGQLRRRIFRRIRIDQAPDADLKAFITASGISGDKETQFLMGVGRKPGALGQIDMTVRLAKLLAAGDEEAGGSVALRHLKTAWQERDVEGLS